jgi:hypothetical protein
MMMMMMMMMTTMTMTGYQPYAPAALYPRKIPDTYLC